MLKIIIEKIVQIKYIEVEMDKFLKENEQSSELEVIQLTIVPIVGKMAIIGTSVVEASTSAAIKTTL